MSKLMVEVLGITTFAVSGLTATVALAVAAAVAVAEHMRCCIRHDVSERASVEPVESSTMANGSKREKGGHGRPHGFTAGAA